LARLPSSRALAPLLAAASLLFFADHARADDILRCPGVDGSAPLLAEIDGRRRLAFVREVMDDQGRRARTWSLAWAVAGLGLVAGNLTRVALVDTRDERIDPLVGAGAALTIPAAILVRPLAVMAHQRTLETELASLPPGAGGPAVCATLARAEYLFARSAADEAFQAGIATQIFVIAGNGAIALFLGLGFDHWRGALLNGGGGLLISEFRIYTQPTGAVAELARYRRGDVQAPTGPQPLSVHVMPWIAQGGAGLAAFGTF
jgi:hypothetical protein